MEGVSHESRVNPCHVPTSALPGVLFLHPLLFPPKPNQPSQTFKIGIDELWTLPKRHGIFESQSWHCQIFSNLLHPIKMCGWLSPKHSQIANKKSCKPHGIMASTWIKKLYLRMWESQSQVVPDRKRTLRSFFKKKVTAAPPTKLQELRFFWICLAKNHDHGKRLLQDFTHVSSTTSCCWVQQVNLREGEVNESCKVGTTHALNSGWRFCSHAKISLETGNVSIDQWDLNCSH